MDWLARQRAVMSEGQLVALTAARVAVVGLGGVGGAAAEALVRAGVGRLTLADFDAVAITDLNRQLLSLGSAVGRLKTAVAAERYRDINPDCSITALPLRVGADNIGEVFAERPNYVIDAVDDVTAKLLLIEYCAANSIKIVSSMGTGNRFDPTKFKIGKITDTAGCGCPLARVMRKELHRRGLDDTLVVYSEEFPLKPTGEIRVGSVSFVPPVAGYVLASCAVRAIINEN